MSNKIPSWEHVTTSVLITPERQQTNVQQFDTRFPIHLTSQPDLISRTLIRFNLAEDCTSLTDSLILLHSFLEHIFEVK